MRNILEFSIAAMVVIAMIATVSSVLDRFGEDVRAEELLGMLIVGIPVFLVVQIVCIAEALFGVPFAAYRAGRRFYAWWTR